MIFELSQLNRTYQTDGYTTEALKEVNLEFKPGDQLMIVGSSGSGKSTLLNIVGLLDRGYRGDYSVDGKSLNKLSSKEQAYYRNKIFGYVFQDYALLETETVYENIKVPLYYSKLPSREYDSLIDDIAKRVGLYEVINKQVRFLSGGQRQRVAIARSLVNKPTVILADEPTGALDEENREIILNIIYDYLDETKILLFVTHDLDKNRRGNQRILKIEEGELRK